MSLTTGNAAYLARAVVSQEGREVHLVVGDNDGYQLHRNGGLVAEAGEQACWARSSNRHTVRLRRGQNELLVKRGQVLKWSLGIREATGAHHNRSDWSVDPADGNPLVELD